MLTITRSHSISILSVIISAIALSAISCEDMIEIDLNSVEPKIVIEAVVTDYWPPCRVTISRTGDFYQPNVFPMVSGAIVEVSDDAGYSKILPEIEPGIYQNDTLRGRPGRTYTLNVEVDGNTYTASSTMPNRIGFSTFGSEYKTGEGYVLHCGFNDPPGVDNYCRIIIEQNGEMLDDYFLYSGEWSDGAYVDYSHGGFRPGDTLVARLLCLDEQTFDYFLTLSTIVTTNENPESIWTPANPNTNLSNGALGYFSAHTVHPKWIIIQ